MSNEETEDQPWHRRADPASPDRCQAVSASGDQCMFVKYVHDFKQMDYCWMHGQGQLKGVKRQAIRLYNLQKHRALVDSLRQDEPNLDEELGILRMTLQETLNKFTDLEMVTQSGRISALVREIRDTLQSNVKLKSQLGQLLDKVVITRLCDSIVALAQEHIPQDRMDAFSSGVAGAIAKAVAERTA